MNKVIIEFDKKKVNMKETKLMCISQEANSKLLIQN